MLTSEIISHYLNAVTEGIKQDASSKNQKIPVSSFREEVSEIGGKLYVADYFKYIIQGRGPGKFPPPEKMLEHVQKNPDMLQEARKIFKYITEKGLAYLIGRKIATHGTDVFMGKKPAIDLEAAIEAPMEDFLKMLAYYEALNVFNKIKQAA
jgi:hypothetical protein